MDFPEGRLRVRVRHTIHHTPRTTPHTAPYTTSHTPPHTTPRTTPHTTPPTTPHTTPHTAPRTTPHTAPHTTPRTTPHHTPCHPAPLLSADDQERRVKRYREHVITHGERIYPQYLLAMRSTNSWMQHQLSWVVQDIPSASLSSVFVRTLLWVSRADG